MHFGTLERILKQFFDDIKKMKSWWFFEIFAIFAKISLKLKCSKNARKMQNNVKNARKNIFYARKMQNKCILMVWTWFWACLVKLKIWESNIAKIMDFDEKIAFFLHFSKNAQTLSASRARNNGRMA